jgi:DNA-binding NtrC family response regulator
MLNTHVQRKMSGSTLTSFRARVLLVDEDRKDLEYHRNLLLQLGCEVRSCRTYAGALHRLESLHFDIVMINQGGPAFEGRLVLEKVVEINRRLPVVVFTRCAEMNLYLEAMQLGAVDYLQKPLVPAEVKRVLRTYTTPLHATV